VHDVLPQHCGNVWRIINNDQAPRIGDDKVEPLSQIVPRLRAVPIVGYRQTMPSTAATTVHSCNGSAGLRSTRANGAVASCLV
jgi:hypothetical protein